MLNSDAKVKYPEEYTRWRAQPEEFCIGNEPRCDTMMSMNAYIIEGLVLLKVAILKIVDVTRENNCDN